MAEPNDVERDLVEGLTGYVEQLKAENRMNEPRVEQWMLEAAGACWYEMRHGEMSVETMVRAIAAAYAPHDVERVLLDLDKAVADFAFTTGLEIVKNQALFGARFRVWCGEDIGGWGDTIPAAVADARRKHKPDCPLGRVLGRPECGGTT